MAVRKPTKRAVPQRRAPRATRRKRSPELWERLVALSEQIPQEELASFPTDGARNLDHYLYGAPKQEP